MRCKTHKKAVSTLATYQISVNIDYAGYLLFMPVYAAMFVEYSDAYSGGYIVITVLCSF